MSSLCNAHDNRLKVAVPSQELCFALTVNKGLYKAVDPLQCIGAQRQEP